MGRLNPFKEESGTESYRPHSQDASPDVIDRDVLAKVIAALISGVSPGDRRDVVYQALAYAPATKRSIIPWFGGIPKNAPVDQVRRVLNGIGARILAMGASGPETTVAQIEKYASSLATGLPYAGDPVVPESGSIPLATAMTLAVGAAHSAADISDEHKQLVDKVLNAAGEVSAAQYTIVPSNMDTSPLSGNFWSSLWDKMKSAAPSVAAGAARGLTMAADKAVADQQREEWESRARSGMTPIDAGGSYYYPEYQMMPYGTVGGGGVSNQVTYAMQQTREQLRQAVAQIQRQAESMASVRQAAEDSVRDMSRMTWGASALEAGDEAATLMAMVKPDFSTAKTTLATVWELIPAAKRSGDLSLWSALVGSVKAAMSRGDLTPSALTALGLMGGDPEQGWDTPAMLASDWRDPYSSRSLAISDQSGEAERQEGEGHDL